MENKIGYYCWAGPGTIRMIREKFFAPRIDEKDLMHSYSYDYLSQIRDIFGITDFWATYSWGFDEKTEAEDYKYFLENIKNFHKAGIKVHAYIQGPNVVYRNFRDKEWYAKDHKNRDIAYYRGRKVTCLNNSEFQNYLVKKIDSLKDTGVDGIYIDNIQNGQMGLPLTYNDMPFVFSGCNCATCQQLFTLRSGEKIPLDFELDPTVTKDFLAFRTEATTDFIKVLAETAHNNKMQFGSNSFDPKYDTEVVFGTSLKEIEKHQDYLLFETHALRDDSSIEKIKPYVSEKKPTFVISYKHGIGYDPELTQKEVDYIFSVASNEKFAPAIKGSEYTTRNVWHNLNPKKLRAPQIIKNIGTYIRKKVEQPRLTKVNSRHIRNVLKEMVNPAYTLFMENRFIRQSFSWAYRNFI